LTVHSQHPFADSGAARDAARRLRGRLGGAVTLWTTGDGTGNGTGRAGLTVSSVMVATGDPARVLGLVDPDSDLAAAAARSGTAVVALLQWPHRDLAEAFAGLAPAPGGLFRLGSWSDTAWGPLLDGVSGWAGIRLLGPGRETGWSLLLEGEVEHVVIDEEHAPLVHRRGRYVRPAQDR
jgi:flavin reductase (DIM6/NTAB) family NADH-FMN oxidoreductase RutF